MRRIIILLFAVLTIISFSSCHEHTFSTDWTSNETVHWHAATCGHDVISDRASHVWVTGEVIREPGYDNTGVVELICEVCGQTKRSEIPRLERQIDLEGTVWRSEDVRYYSDYNHNRLSGRMFFYFYKNGQYSIKFISDKGSSYSYDSGYWEKTSGDEFRTWYTGPFPSEDRYQITVKGSGSEEEYHFKDPVDGGYFEYFSGIY